MPHFDSCKMPNSRYTTSRIKSGYGVGAKCMSKPGMNEALGCAKMAE
jgi:hypothetical protein